MPATRRSARRRSATRRTQSEPTRLVLRPMSARGSVLALKGSGTAASSTTRSQELTLTVVPRVAKAAGMACQAAAGLRPTTCAITWVVVMPGQLPSSYAKAKHGDAWDGALEIFGVIQGSGRNPGIHSGRIHAT